MGGASRSSRWASSADGRLGTDRISICSSSTRPTATATKRAELFGRIAQRVLRLVGTPHGEGPGYELDTRLRPSGSQGLLVVSMEAFARYQVEQAEGWERQALLKARACAGDADLGQRVLAVAQAAAYERGAPESGADAPLAHPHGTRADARAAQSLARAGTT